MQKASHKKTFSFAFQGLINLLPIDIKEGVSLSRYKTQKQQHRVKNRPSCGHMCGKIHQKLDDTKPKMKISSEQVTFSCSEACGDHPHPTDLGTRSRALSWHL